MTSPPDMAKPPNYLHDLSPDFSFLETETGQGVKIRRVCSSIDGAEIVYVPCTHAVVQALNEECMRRGRGELYWLPDRMTRSDTSSVPGGESWSQDGPDAVYIDKIHIENDVKLYNALTPYERLHLSSGFGRLSASKMVLPIYIATVDSDKAAVCFPANMSGQPRFTFGTTAIVLVWDDFPHLCWRDQVNVNSWDTDTPRWEAAQRQPYRLRTCGEVVDKLEACWRDPYYSDLCQLATMEEVATDSMMPGAEQSESYGLVALKSERLQKRLEAKAGV